MTVNAAGLAAGTYTGTITIASSAAPSLVIPVNVKVSSNGPQFTASGVLNMASFQPGPIAPGEMIRITGVTGGATGFAATAGAADFAAATILETRVLFDGTPIPLLSVGTGEIRAMAPFELDGASSTQIQVEFQGQKSAAVTVKVAPAQPGIFTADLTGRGQAVAQHWNPDATGPRQNITGSPVLKGGILAFFATGGGQLMPPGRTGALHGVIGALRLPVQVTIGGKSADVIYAGGSPGFQEGVTQFNVRVPMDAPSGDAVPLAVTINGVVSPAGPTIVVQ